ncbi:hypothetical protein GVX86_01140 [[Haemophilus] felis]|nr:hypothetical protein [[Haemophilus] felis]
MHFQLKVHIKNNAPEIINFQVNNKTPLIIQHSNQEVLFELFDKETQLAPQKLVMKRDGNNLHIFIDDNDQVDVIIVDYYAYEPLSPVVGLAEDGRLYAYLAESNLASDSIPYLAENVLASQVLSGTGVTLGSAPFNWTPFLYALGGLMGAGLAAAALGGSGDGGNATTPPAINVRHSEARGKKNGGIEVETTKGVKSYEIEFVPTNGGKPISIRFEAEGDTFKLTEESKAKLPAGANVPEVVKAGEPIKLLGDLIRDGSAVKVTAVDNNGVTNSTTIDAPFDNNIEKLELGKIEVLNTRPSAVKLPIDTDVGSKVSVLDKAGKIVAGSLPVDSKGHKTLEFLLDPNDPNRNELTDFTVVVEKPGANPASSKLADLPAEKLPTNPVNVDPVELSQPTITPSTESEAGKKFDVNLGDKKDNVEAINVFVTDSKTNKTAVEKIEKNEQGKFTAPTDPNSKIEKVVDNGDGTVTVVLKDEVPKDSKVSVATENANSQSKPSEPLKVTDTGVEAVDTTAEQPEPTSKPSLVDGSIKSINQGESTPTNPEAVEFKLNNVSPNATLIPTLVKADGTKIPLPTVKADVNSVVRLADTKEADIQAGDKIELVAQDPNKGASETLEITVPAVNDHRFDSLPPVEPKIEIPTTPGEGGATVDASGIKVGETLAINVVKPKPAPNGTPATLKFTKQEDGSLKPAESNPQDVTATVNGDKVTIDEGSLKDNSPISAAITDPAGNSTEAEPKTVGYDNPTERTISLDKLSLEDKDPVANHQAERIKGEVNGVKAGDTLHFEDDQGNKLPSVKVPDNHEEGKPFAFDIPSNNDNKNPTSIKVSVQEEGKAPTEPVSGNIDPNSLTHTDNQAPPAASIAQNDEKLSVAFDPTQTDKLSLINQDTGKPIVSFTKDPETGVFKSDNPQVPDIPAGSNIADIPRTALPKEVVNVVAKTSDISDKSEESVSVVTPIKPLIEAQTAAPQNVSVKAIDTTSPKGDSTPELFEVSGTAPEGARLIFTANGKTFVTDPVPEGGQFKFLIPVTALGDQNLRSDEITIQAKKEGERASEPQNLPASVVEKNPESHLGDLYAPDVPEPVASGSHNRKFKVSPDTDSVNVEYTDKSGYPQPAADKQPVVTRNEQGELVSNDPNITVSKDTEGNEYITVSSEATKPNSDIRLVAKDIAGRESDPTVVAASSETAEVVADNNPPVDAGEGGENSEGSSSSDDNQPNASQAPAKPTLTLGGKDKGGAVGDVLVDFPENAQLGDQVVLKYKPVEAGKTADQTETKQLVFKKGENGWEIDPAATTVDTEGLPAVDTQSGKPKFTLPGDKVRDNTTVEAYSKSADNTKVTESTFVVTELDGDGAAGTDGSPAVPKTPTPVINNISGVDEDGDGIPDVLRVEGKVEGAPIGTEVVIRNQAGGVVATGKTIDAEGNFVATGGKPTEPEKATTKDDQLTAVAKAPNQEESAVSNSKAIEKENIATPAVDHSTPNSTVAPTSEGAIVRLDPNAKEGDKSVVRTQPKNENGEPSGDPKEDTYVFKDGKWQPDPSDNDAPPVTNGNEVNVIAPSNAEISVTNSNSNNPPNSSTTSPVTSGRPAEATQPEVNNVATTNSPKDLTVTTLFDDNNPADGNTDRFVITGTVEGGAEGTELFVYDAEGNKLITSDLKWGENGTFTVTVSESPNKDLEFGRQTPDTLTFVAKDKDKNPSAEASLALATQENKANPEKAFPNDTTAPQQATVTPNVADGGVRVKLPNDAVAGDKLAVKYTPTGADAEKTVTFIKQPDGSWKTEPADPDFPATIPASETYLTIPESLLKDDSKVTATITDLAGHSIEHSAQAGDDASTGRIVDLTIEGIDLDNPANLSAEKVKIKGKVQGAGADVPVKVTLPNGQEITVNTKDNGEFEIVLVKEGANNPQVEGETAHTVPSLDFGDQLSVQATEAGKKPSETETLTVPAVATSKTGANGEEEPLTPAEKQALHPNDKTNDLPVTLTAATEEGDGSVSLALPANAQVGDQVEVEYIPDNQEADEPKAKLTLTKTENGWQSSEPRVVIDGNKATLPETLLKDGKEVTAKVIDLVGNENPATAPATAGQDELTPKLASIKVVDTNNQADSVVDALIVKGTAEPGSTVSLGKEGNLTALGTLTAGADTNFTALIINPNAENTATDEQIAALKAKLGLPADTPVIKAIEANKLAAGDKLTISAQTTDTGNAAQTGTPKEVPALTATGDEHPFDTTPPADITLAESDTQGAMKVKLPAEAKVGDTLVLDFKKPAEANADPAEPIATEAEYVKQADGSWKIVGDNPHGLPATIPTVAEGTQQELEIPKDKLADNQPVTAKLVDQAGNSSAKPATMNAPFDEKTSLEDVKLTSKNEAQAGTKDPDILVVEGYTQPGAKVTIVLTKADGTEVTKEITAPTTAEQGRQDGLAKFTHTFKEGEDGVGTDGINTGEGNNVEITAVLENQRAPNSLTKAIPPTRTVFLEVNETVDVVDKGKLTGTGTSASYNKDISDSVIDEVKLTGYIEENAKLVVEVRDAQGAVVAKGTFAKTPDTNAKESALGYKDEILSTQDNAKVNGNNDKVTAGKFEVVLTREHLQAGKSFEKGQTVTVRAENTDSAVSKGDESKTGFKLPALDNFSATDHPEDTKVVTELAVDNAAATGTEGNKTAFVEFASETSGEHKGKQQATVKLPKESSEVIKAELKLINERTDLEATVVITRDPQGKWRLDEEGTQNLGLSITPASEEGAFPSIQIPHNVLKGNGNENERGTVKLTLTDPANQTLTLEKPVPADATTYLKVGKVTPVDVAASNISDGNPDKVKVEVEAEVDTTVTVTINGKTVTKKIEANDGTPVENVTDANGETVNNVRKVVIEVNEDPNQPIEATSQVNVSATRTDHKADSSDNSKTVGNNVEYEGDNQVQGWTTNPVTVKHDPTTGLAEAEVAVPDAAETDVNSFTIQFNKQGETSNPVEVTYTKGTNGEWKTEDAKGTTLDNGKVKIPANVLNGGVGEKIKVKATDIAGNQTGQESNQYVAYEEDAANLPKTAQPTAPTVRVQDLDREADDTVEKVFITGTGAPANSEVFLLNAQGQRVQNAAGQEIKTTAGQDGGYSFTLTTREPENPQGVVEHKVTAINTGKKYKVQALAAGSSPSDPVETTEAVPTTVPRGSQQSNHPKDTTDPAQVRAEQGEDNVVVSVPANDVKKGDRLVIKDLDQDPNGTGTVIGTFDFDGTSWTAEGSTTLTVPTKSDDQSKWEVKVPTSDQIVSGDYIKAELQDYAGNSTSQSAKMPNVDPHHIDPVEVFVGTTTKDTAADSNKDPRKADRLKVEDSEAVNSGDIYIKPGADNTEVTISYLNEQGQAKHVVAEKSNSTWMFYEGTVTQGEDANAGTVTKTQTQVHDITVKQVNNATYFKLAADSVRDHSQVQVYAKDKQNNRVQASKMSDFDDNTENNVTGVSPVQATATDNISITLSGQEDAVYYVVSFDASHIQANDANTLGVSNQSGAHNFIVVRKGSDGKWSANFFAGKNGETRNSFDYRSEGESAVPYLQSFNKDTGSIVLKKDYVKGSSDVTAKFVDAYGMTNETSKNTVHTSTSSAPIQVDAPEVNVLGNGLMSIVAGKVDYHEQGGNIQPKGTDFKTVVTHNGQTYTIVYETGTGDYRLDEPQSDSKKVSFDSATGKLVLSSTAEDKVTAVAEKMYNGQKYTSEQVDGTFITAPPSKAEDIQADSVEVLPQKDGSVFIKTGLDNTHLEVHFVLQKAGNTTSKKAVYTRSGPTETWVAQDQQGGDAYTSDEAGSYITVNGADGVTINNSQVMDGTKVYALVKDVNNNQADHYDYSKVDDGSPGEAGIGSVNSNNNNASVTVNTANDHTYVEVEFEIEPTEPEEIDPSMPGGGTANLFEKPKEKIVLQLERDSWTLKYKGGDKDGQFVPSAVAELENAADSQGNSRPMIKIKDQAIAELGSVSVVAYDGYGNSKPFSGTAGNKNSGGGSGELTKAVQPTHSKGVANSPEQGSVTITPGAGNDRLNVEYANERGGLVTATLIKEQNSWKVVRVSQGGKIEDFDLTGGKIKLKAEALDDSPTSMVKVRGGQEGKLDSDVLHIDPDADYTPPPPPKPPVFTDLNTKIGENQANTVVVENDVVYRSNVPSEGWKQLEAKLKEKGLGTLKAPHTADNDLPFTDIRLTEKSSDGVTLRVHGAIGSSSPHGDWNATYWAKGVKLAGTAKDDAIVTAADFGEDEVNAREHELRLGDGNDILVVGGNNTNHTLWEKQNENDATKRYAFNMQNQSGWTQIDKVEHNGKGSSDNSGGVLTKAHVDMGAGNDVITIDGSARNIKPAVNRSYVNLDSGDDTLLIAYPDEASMPSGARLKNYDIGEGSTVRAGAGNDFIKAGGISGNAKVYMEGDKDRVEVLRIYGSDTVLDMGDGSDTLVIKSEVRDGATIRLGDGNDIIEFGGGKSLLGGYGKESLFEGKLDGGSGYDILVLKTPSTNNAFIGLQVSNMSTANFKGIEEVHLQAGTILDVRYEDLLNSDAGILKIRSSSEQNNDKKQRRVDLGATNSNNFGNQDLTEASGKSWSKVQEKTELGVQYEVYAVNGDLSHAVWIEKDKILII